MTALVLVISSLLTIWTQPDGTPIYVQHARRHGNEEHIRELARETLWAERRYGIGRYLLVSLAYHESGLNPDASNPVVGAWGLFALHPRSRWGRRAAEVCERSPEDCLHAQFVEGVRAFRYALEVCEGELEAVSFHRSGRCDLDRARERVVLELRDRLRAAAFREEGVM